VSVSEFEIVLEQREKGKHSECFMLSSCSGTEGKQSHCGRVTHRTGKVGPLCLVCALKSSLVRKMPEHKSYIEEDNTGTAFGEFISL
jgi:hypothetical protein